MELVLLACKTVFLARIKQTANFVILDFTLSMGHATIPQCRIAYFTMELSIILCAWHVNQDFICQEVAAINAKDVYCAAKRLSVFQNARVAMSSLTMPAFLSNSRSFCFGLSYF